jgi:hypothetical protein
MLELGILAYGPRAEDDVTLVKRVIHTFQPGMLLQQRDLGGAYNLNSLLITSTGQYYASIAPTTIAIVQSEDKDNG